jgi:hypothetical protein
MVTLRRVQRAAEREEQFRTMQQALRRTFDYVAAEPVPERLRALVETLEHQLKNPRGERARKAEKGSRN